MTAQQLKNSILQMAVQGKLVPQNPDDEPASVLLEKIRAEKEQLIKEGKIKKDKKQSYIFKGDDNLPYEKIGNEVRCIADEVPFDIPDNWCWCRIGQIFNLQAGKNISANEITDEPFEQSYPCYGGNGLRGYVKLYNRDGYFALIGRQGALCGNINFANGKFYATEHAVVVETFSDIDVTWCGIFLLALNLNQYATATAQPGLAVRNINQVFIPLPPFAEQQRIVAKIEEILPYIEKYNIAEKQLEFLNINFPEQLKKSILQQAVQGKLVPQSKDDEPASVLLEKIRAEKQQLIKEGKIKKDKNESIIFKRDKSHYERIGNTERCIDDEIPFEIPDNWAWCRLGSMSTYAYQKKKINAIYADNNMWQLDLENIEKGGKLLTKKTVGELKAKGDKVCFEKGDILYSKLRPYLLKVLIAADDGICTPEIVPFKLYGKINAEYIVYLLKSPYIDSLVNSKTYGVKMPRVGTETMINILIPLPPITEQKRIVSQITKVLSYCDKL
jgi:type I restriction enzyme S subunit